jgi:TusA-related sulfurtransferase
VYGIVLQRSVAPIGQSNPIHPSAWKVNSQEFADWHNDLQYKGMALPGKRAERRRHYEPLHRLTRRTLVSAEVERERALMELDVRGSVCPGPTGDTLAALKKLSAGDKLIVITDYLPARQTIPRLVEQRGCSWQITEDDGKTFRLEIVKGV